MSEELEKQVSEETSNEESLVAEQNPSKKHKRKKSTVRKVLEWAFTVVFSILFVFLAIGQVDGMIHRNDNYGQTLTYGYGSFIIKTDSMEPEYPVNIAIVTHKDDIEDVVKSYNAGETIDITFFDYYNQNNGKYDYILHKPTDTKYNERTASIAEVMTHRLREVFIDEAREYGKGRYTFVVSGTNVSEHQAQAGQYQLLTENEFLGVVKVRSNALGGFFGFISSPWGLLVFLLVPAMYLVVTSVMDIFKAIKEPDEEGEAKPEEANASDKPKSASLEGLSEKDKERLKREMLEEMMNKKKGDK